MDDDLLLKAAMIASSSQPSLPWRRA